MARIIGNYIILTYSTGKKGDQNKRHKAFFLVTETGNVTSRNVKTLKPSG